MSPEEMNQLLEQAVKDWDIIRENPTLFLSNHKGKVGELYRSNLQISRVNAFVKYLISAVKNLLSIFVTTPDIAWSEADTTDPSIPLTHAIITLAGDKYHYDAERIQQGVLRRGKRCTLILIGSKTGEAICPIFSHRIRAAGTYLERTCRLCWQASDSGRRLLLASHTLNAVRTECLIHVAFSRQNQIKDLKKVISIVPFNQISRSLTETCDTLGIETYALRTQTVNLSPSHLAINTKYLFYRTEQERKVYATLQPLLTCEMKPGGIYNFPPMASHEPPPSVAKSGYLLILGTTPANHETFDQWRAQTRKMIAFANEFRLEIIYKSHNLALEWDKQILPQDYPDIKHHTNITDNRTLIDNADLIMTFPSTLLYYILQTNKPFILLSNAIHSQHEFSKLSCVEVDMEKNLKTIDLQNVLNASQVAANRFHESFNPSQNEDRLIGELTHVA